VPLRTFLRQTRLAQSDALLHLAALGFAATRFAPRVGALRLVSSDRRAAVACMTGC